MSKRKTIPKKIKALVWTKYIGDEIGKTKCFCCNETDIKQIEFHCGHVQSVKNGGSNYVDNLRPICSQCNLSMGSQNMDEFKQIFIKKSVKTDDCFENPVLLYFNKIDNNYCKCNNVLSFNIFSEKCNKCNKKIRRVNDFV